MLQEVIKVRPWIDCSQRTPKKEGWYAVQDSTVEGEYYMDAYWLENSWWTFGRYANVLNVRREVRGVLRWRFMGEVGRTEILRLEKSAVVPRDPFQRIQVGMVRRLRMLYLICQENHTQQGVAKAMDTTGKVIGRMIDAVVLWGVEIGERGDGKLFVLNWGPISQEWVYKNAEVIRVAYEETHKHHGNALGESRDFQALPDVKTARIVG